MIASRFKELRKRRGLMITLILVTVGIPTVFLVIRLLLHAFAPKTYGPAGGYAIYTATGLGRAVRLRLHRGRHPGRDGGIRRPHRGDVPAPGGDRPLALGAVSGSDPRGTRHHRAAGGGGLHHRLRGVRVRRADPPRLQRCERARQSVARRPRELGRRPCRRGHLQLRLQDRTVLSRSPRCVNSVPCGNGPGGGPAIVKQPPGSQGQPQASQAQIREAASLIARMNYSDYARQFLYPSNSLMVKSGLWLELEAVIGFVVGLGLGSLIGQRTVAVIMMIVLEVVLTPILSRARIPHLSNLQRAVVGLATAHLAPGGLPVLGGGGGGPAGGGGNPGLLPESTTVAVCVIVAWLVGWSVLGAWRMMTRDA